VASLRRDQGLPYARYNHFQTAPKDPSLEVFKKCVDMALQDMV